MDFDRLITQAQSMEFAGWDFSVFGDRFTDPEPSWSYRQVVSGLMGSATAVLDMGTGGGELLAELLPVDARVCATEGYPPNLPVARERLEPLGVSVSATHTENNEDLPFGDGLFDLVINRHESFDAGELARVMAPGGRFVTQQIGGRYMLDLNEALGGPLPDYADWDLKTATAQLADVGFTIAESREEFGDCVFTDIGAVVMYLRIVSWQVPDFTVEAYRDSLMRLHERMERDGAVRFRGHGFLLQAVAPL